MSFPSKGRDIRSEWLCVCVCVCVYICMCLCVCAHVHVPMVFTLCEYSKILSTWLAILRKTFDLLCFISSQNIQISNLLSAVYHHGTLGLPFID